MKTNSRKAEIQYLEINYDILGYKVIGMCFFGVNNRIGHAIPESFKNSWKIELKYTNVWNWTKDKMFEISAWNSHNVQSHELVLDTTYGRCYNSKAASNPFF